jgi:hypothetical protein
MLNTTAPIALAGRKMDATARLVLAMLAITATAPKNID